MLEVPSLSIDLSPQEEVASSRGSPTSPVGDQGARLLEQMRTCVLVHHQLSCLLIHSAALQAGLYGESENLDECMGEGRAVRQSIQSLGGSTARLFCMALRDRKDLRSMGETLSTRVDEMVAGLQKEVSGEDGSLVAECAQLEADLDVRQREAKRLRAQRAQQRQQREDAQRKRVFEEAAKVKALEERRQALTGAMENLLKAGLSSEAAEGPAAKAASALLGSTPIRPRGRQTQSLQRQLHQNQLERRRITSPVRVVTSVPAVAPVTSRSVAVATGVATGQTYIRGRHVPAHEVNPSLAQLGDCASRRTTSGASEVPHDVKLHLSPARAV